jgi:hypothetical protein
MKPRRPWVRIATLVVALATLPLVAVTATDTAGAEKPTAVELPQPLTRKAIRELVARLSDAEVRKLLLVQLDKAAAPATSQAAAPMATGLAGDMDRTRSELSPVRRDRNAG